MTATHPASAALERHAPEIAERFLAVSDDLIDPAVFLDAVDGHIFIVENLSLVATMAQLEVSEQIQSEPGSIVVAVVADEHVYRQRAWDPRFHPDRWPWAA